MRAGQADGGAPRKSRSTSSHSPAGGAAPGAGARSAAPPRWVRANTAPASARGGPGAGSAPPLRSASGRPADDLAERVEHGVGYARRRQQPLLHAVVVLADLLLLRLGAEPRGELMDELGAPQLRAPAQLRQERGPDAALAGERPLDLLGDRRGRRALEPLRVELAPRRLLEVGVDQPGQQLTVRAGDARQVRARVGVAVLAARLLVLREQLQDVRHGSPPVSLPSSSSSLKRRWKRDAI